MKIAVNGVLCDEREAQVSVYDHGFLYGIGLFETFRTYGGRPFLLEPHLQRLAAGCLELGIRYEPDSRAIRQLLDELLEANDLEDAYIRYTVSAGEDLLGLPAGDYKQPNVIVYVKPLPERASAVDEQGKPIQLLALRRNTPEGAVRLKSFHYMNNILAKKEMQQYPWAAGAEGVFLDGRGNVAEGIVSNLFWLKDGVCRTPSLETGILPGITRQFVMELAEANGCRVEEGLYGWDALLEAEEVWLTNSIQEIVPVSKAFGSEGRLRVIGTGTAGAFTRKLIEAYRSSVR